MLRTYKIFFITILATIFFSLANITFAAESANELLARIERDTYGMSMEGALLSRLNRIEKDYSGTNLQEDLNGRIEALRTIIYDNSTAPGIMAKVNAIEWNFNHEVQNDGIVKRLENLEEAILGEVSDDTIINRVRELARASFGRDDIPMEEIQLPMNTVIKVALVNDVGTREGQIGDTVNIKVVEDVIIDGNLVFARGLYGTGVITELTRATDWGRNGKLVIDFHKIKCIDGNEINTTVGFESEELMTEKKMVAGASLIGLDIYDEWNKGMIFGKNIQVPADTELYIQTKELATVYALKSGRGSLSIDKSDSEFGDDFGDLDDDFKTDFFNTGNK